MAVYATCTYHLYRSKKFPWMQQIYITVLFVLAAVTIACNINFNELAWIDERNYPGGRYLANKSENILTLARQALWLVVGKSGSELQFEPEPLRTGPEVQFKVQKIC